MDGCYYVYILANRRYGTRYVGVTDDLPRRVWEHKHDVVPGFTHEHGIHHLVWYEVHDSRYEATSREKLIKKWHRDWKVNLIQAMNPKWDDLYDGLAA
jgi:putative endonuclease